MVFRRTSRAIVVALAGVAHVGAQEGAASRPQTVTSELRAPLADAMELLSLVSDGSTLRTGPHRARAKELVQTLKNAQAMDGGFGALREDASQVPSQAWCTLALALTAHASKYRLLVHPAELGTKVLLGVLPKATEAGLELVVPCALLAEVLQEAAFEHGEPLRLWLAAWLDAKAPLGPGILLPEVAVRLLVAEVLVRGDVTRDAAATALAKECATRFAAAVAAKQTNLDELTLLALGWCRISTERFVAVDFPVRQLEAALIAVRAASREPGDARGKVEPRGPWASEAGPEVALALATILESLGFRSSRLARR